jgi:hypothetical protein
VRRRKGPWKVVLIVEDDTDGRACRALAQAARVRAEIDWLPAHGIGNIKRNGARLIALARDRLKKPGCVAVLIGRDRQDMDLQDPHRSIARICRDAGVPLIAAREALEAWFLADPGICRWLGLRSPANTESLPDPKGMIDGAFQKRTARPYRKGRARMEVARRASGPDRSRNASLAEAFEHLSQCRVL